MGWYWKAGGIGCRGAGGPGEMTIGVNENLYSTCEIYLYVMDIDSHKAVSFLPFVGCCPHT